MDREGYLLHAIELFMPSRSMKYNKVGKMTHTAEIESDAHDVHHHEKEAFHFRQFVPSSFRNPIPIKLLSGFGFN